MADSISPNKGFLNRIERVGNAMPSITMLFLYALIICWILSLLLSFVQFDYVNPLTKENIVVVNMFNYDEIVTFLTKMVGNFITFPPLSITIVATLGIGIAEGSGFINTALKKMLSFISPKMLTPTVAFVGVVAHVVSDSAYVILMPVSALMFYASGRHPLAGIATAFAGLAGGFTASYTPSQIDPILQSFTEKAAHLLDPSYSVNVLCNYFFSLGGTFGVILVCWFVTEKIVEPWLNKTCPIDCQVDQADNINQISPSEAKGFRWAGFTIIGLIALLAILLYPDSSPFRAPNGSLTSSAAPVMQAIVPLLFIFFAVPGLVYGFVAGTFKSSKDVTSSMENITKSLISFIVFCFIAAQFLYSFGHSNIGTLISIAGADLLRSLSMPAWLTIIGMILLSSCINLIITSATSKWAIMAPVMVPMLMAVGLSPELTQASFRISAAVNISTPMFPFYPLILSYCHKYCSKAGVGTLCSMMIPFSIGIWLVLVATLFIYWGFEIPIGFDSSYTYSVPPTP
ncbi:aminobenzoyl-glutamate transport protein [Orbus hercynius]|uniref:Aminobenzoyl-glutamate transport protein n=1 Tax=Orbus hercynius TaxID=593135 RepID=A0A495RJT7_9GAMM|nr:AbgT family transporter [Orbus hercynius]RKS87574.1 aminobenzoyl-glutamate transport protein [Orbus hercynius]